MKQHLPDSHWKPICLFLRLAGKRNCPCHILYHFIVSSKLQLIFLHDLPIPSAPRRPWRIPRGPQSTGIARNSPLLSSQRRSRRAESDIDILVQFSQTPGIFEFLRLKQYLEDLLGKPVDLVTEGVLKKQLREGILREAVRVS
ncbi:nucleotidyltransferase family protein [Desulfoprunum benzoelyticum]|uniref:nucleotidyltransferase family protein n=1 Tax=Desulfoprunum benzoelyticum TaxID=1506996 RepID=UPI00338F011C